jgi:polar amino acid transport system substrate-binding protein
MTLEKIKYPLISVLFLVTTSFLQKYISLGEFIFSVQFYLIPIFSGLIFGTYIMFLLNEKEELNNRLIEENQVLRKNKLEINSLYDELEANSQEIDSLKVEAEKYLMKYKILLQSIQDIKKYRNLSEKDFIIKMYKIGKLIISGYDYSSVYIYKDSILKIIETEGYDKKGINSFKLTVDLVNKVFPKTDIYNTEKISLSNEMSENKKREFFKNAKESKEMLFLRINNNSKSIGGMFFEIKRNSNNTFAENDLSIILAFQKIIESYYEGIHYEQIIEKQMISIVEALSSMLEYHDPYTKGHSKNVAKYAKEIAIKLNLSKHEVDIVYLSGLLHDIGKTFVDVDLLNKKEKLTKREFEKIKEHPSSGANVIRNIEGLSDIEQTIRHHHERIDGMGYPDGLNSNKIPLHSKIIAVADAYDAMVTNRPYRNRLSHEEAIKELLSHSGSQFSKEIVNVFLEILETSEIDEEHSN